jgi:hypothetical protein
MKMFKLCDYKIMMKRFLASKVSVVCWNDFRVIQGYSEYTALLQERQMSSYK